MASIHAANVDKPVELIKADSLSPAERKHFGKALEAVVEQSGIYADLTHGIHAHSPVHMPFLKKLIPGLEDLASKYHFGNYVAMRGTDEKFFESMPIYARIGMHLLFYGHEQVELLETKKVEDILREQSIKQGKLFDDPKSAQSIEHFVKTYSLQLDELLVPDLSQYKTFNEFFYRKLKVDARPVQNADDSKGICSAADCRLTVYQTVDLAKQFWIKGRNFTISNLLGVPAYSDQALAFNGSSLAIFRLAPADYHRFHSPIDGEVGELVHIPGQYYTVNPQAVNEPTFDVFTANTRSVLYMKHTITGLPVAFVAIGALLVGSINWTNGGQKGSTVKRGEELGYFAYGGSTVVAVLPPGAIQFDDDLVKNSEADPPIETLVKVGYSLGKTPE
jgi:phosphatidylserine decarboxylase